MIRLLDGPAGDTTLMLRRDPAYLRIVINRAGEIDGLDELDDEPRPQERLYVYRRVARRGVVHVNMGNRKATGFYPLADYRQVDVDGELLRDTAAWRAWTLAQPAAAPEVSARNA